jgi:hypothetical protein
MFEGSIGWYTDRSEDGDGASQAPYRVHQGRGGEDIGALEGLAPASPPTWWLLSGTGSVKRSLCRHRRARRSISGQGSHRHVDGDARFEQLVKDIGEERIEIPRHTHWFLLLVFTLGVGFTLVLSVEVETVLITC